MLNIFTKGPKESFARLIVFGYGGMCGDATHADVRGIDVDNKDAGRCMNCEQVLHGKAERLVTDLMVRQKSRVP